MALDFNLTLPEVSLTFWRDWLHVNLLQERVVAWDFNAMGVTPDRFQRAAIGGSPADRQLLFLSFLLETDDRRMDFNDSLEQILQQLKDRRNGVQNTLICAVFSPALDRIFLAGYQNFGTRIFHSNALFNDREHWERLQFPAHYENTQMLIEILTGQFASAEEKLGRILHNDYGGNIPDYNTLIGIHLVGKPDNYIQGKIRYHNNSMYQYLCRLPGFDRADLQKQLMNHCLQYIADHGLENKTPDQKMDRLPPYFTRQEYKQYIFNHNVQQ